MEISAVIITLNEERNIRRCLESVKKIADEIIVVDSFSTDRTESICREYGVKFSTHPFENYISQKNYAISLAGKEYVLSIDADEALDARLTEEILSLKKSGVKAPCYDFPRLTNYCSERWIKHCGWYPDRAMRLFCKDKAHFEGLYIHERIVIEGNPKPTPLKGNLLHYSYYNISEHVLQAEKFSTLSARQYVAQGKSVTLAGVIIRSTWTFLRSYFIQLGFLDGWAGYKVCFISSYATFLKYAKVREIIRNKDNSHSQD